MLWCVVGNDDDLLTCVLSLSLSLSSSPLLFSKVLLPCKIVVDDNDSFWYFISDSGRCRVGVLVGLVVSHRTTTGAIRLAEDANNDEDDCNDNASLTTMFVEIAIVNRNGIKGFTDDDEDIILFILCHIVLLCFHLLFR